MAPQTLHEERRELWSTLLESLRRPDPDPAHASACSYLLRHLIDSAVPPKSAIGYPLSALS